MRVLLDTQASIWWTTDDMQLSQTAFNTIANSDNTIFLSARALKIWDLPTYHRDPFDRILIAQSQVEEIPIITIDSAIAQYTSNIV